MRGDFRTAAPLGESASERPADENFQFASTLFVLELCLCVCISSHDYYFILLFFFEILSKWASLRRVSAVMVCEQNENKNKNKVWQSLPKTTCSGSFDLGDRRSANPRSLCVRQFSCTWHRVIAGFQFWKKSFSHLCAKPGGDSPAGPSSPLRLQKFSPNRHDNWRVEFCEVANYFDSIRIEENSLNDLIG